METSNGHILVMGDRIGVGVIGIIAQLSMAPPVMVVRVSRINGRGENAVSSLEDIRVEGFHRAFLSSRAV